MEQPGIDLLYPIWNLIEGQFDPSYDDKYGLELANDDVKVFYTTYVNDLKRELQPNEHSIRIAIDEKLTPGSLVYFH